MKKCPECELNWIKDDQELCDLCKNKPYITTPHNRNKLHPFAIRDFVIKNTISTIDVDTGFDFYDLRGRKLGIVFATHDKQYLPSYGKCEMRFYPEYEQEFRRYHRFKTNGERLDFLILKAFLSKNEEKRITID